MSANEKAKADTSKQLLDLVHSASLADDFDGVLGVLLDRARSQVPSDGISVMWLEDDHLKVLASSGPTAPLPGLTLPANQMGAALALLDSGQAVLVPDTSEDARWQRVPGEEQVRSWLVAPLLLEDRTVGLLEWTARAPGRFTEEDVEVAVEIALHVAPILHRVQLLDDTRGRLRELVEPQLTSAPQEVDLSLELQPVVREALDAASARHAFIFLQSQSRQALHCVAAAGARRERLKRTLLRGDGTLGGWMSPPDHSGRWPRAGPTDHEVMSSLGIDNTLILPLRVGGDPVGVLGVADPRRGRRFGQDCIRLLTHLASQASLIAERTQRARVDSERFDYGMVVQSSPLGIGVVTVTGAIRVCNPALVGLFSRSERTLAGRNLSEFLVDGDDRRFTHALEEVAVTGQRRQVDARIRSVLGEERHVRISLAPAHVSRDVGGNLVAMLEDITSLKILEQERVDHLSQLSEKHRQLTELNQLKSRFVSNVSHELRTPLAVIKLYATLARKGRPEKQRHYLQTIEQETQRLETMVENLLDLARLDREVLRVHLEMVDTGEIIIQVLGVYAEASKRKGIELSAEVEDGLPPVLADRNHLIQMLTNLVDNALKYTPPGGRVWVTANELASGSGQFLEIAVGDTGAGIPLEEHERVFERFYRGSNNSPGSTGTGLGLAIVQELMQQHSGELTLDSRTDEGSIFSLQFPVASSDRAEETSSRPIQIVGELQYAETCDS